MKKCTFCVWSLNSPTILNKYWYVPCTRYDKLRHGRTRDELGVINSEDDTRVRVDRHDAKAKIQKLYTRYLVWNICAPRDDALGPIETTAGEHHRSLNGFVPVPPRDYRAQNSGQLNNVVAVEKTPRYSTSVVCKTSWQGTSLINLNL